MFMEPTFRWYGPKDPVPLSYIRQAGATGVVTSLHEIPYGEVWSVEAIRNRCELVERSGMNWSVIESLPVHEDIKLGAPTTGKLLENYKQSIRNLGAVPNAPRVITYNFMPVLDWIRTDLHHELPDGSRTLYFDLTQFVAFEVFILKRPGAENDYSAAQLARGEAYFKSLSPEAVADLTRSIIDNFPGFKGVTLEDVRRMLGRYDGVSRAQLEDNLSRFLAEVCPVCEEFGCRMAIHPDDPPRSILGLPRIFSNLADVKRLLTSVNSPANGICFCSGSFSAGKENDILELFRAASDRIAFLHLRSTQHEGDGNFFEAEHLEGRVDMYALVKAVCEEQIRRRRAGRADWRIPVRPDHGHDIMDDLAKPPCPNPGYHALGRMRGLAELRGLELGVMRSCYAEELAVGR